jgi:5-methylcytosine-specific restriction protein A
MLIPTSNSAHGFSNGLSYESSMTRAGDLKSIYPLGKRNVYDILQDLDFDVRDWANYKAGKGPPAANPRYCYEWSFLQHFKGLAVCMWHAELSEDGAKVFYKNNVRGRPEAMNPRSQSIWLRRARALDANLQLAYLNALPVHSIVLMGRRRDRNDPEAIASAVHGRALDPAPWAIVEYDFDTGDFMIERGATPAKPAQWSDPESQSFPEGDKRRAFRAHRHREARAREAKIADFRSRNGNRLFCEVPRCSFDFGQRYGALGEGYAHVHHLTPLGSRETGTVTTLDQLAIVCANCHAMIHLGGECRDIATLIS